MTNDPLDRAQHASDLGFNPYMCDLTEGLWSDDDSDGGRTLLSGALADMAQGFYYDGKHGTGW